MTNCIRRSLSYILNIKLSGSTARSSYKNVLAVRVFLSLVILYDEFEIYQLNCRFSVLISVLFKEVLDMSCRNVHLWHKTLCLVLTGTFLLSLENIKVET